MEHLHLNQPMGRRHLSVLASINDHLSAFRLLLFHPLPLLVGFVVVIIINYFPSQLYETWLQGVYWK